MQSTGTPWSLFDDSPRPAEPAHATQSLTAERWGLAALLGGIVLAALVTLVTGSMDNTAGFAAVAVSVVGALVIFYPVVEQARSHPTAPVPVYIEGGKLVIAGRLKVPVAEVRVVYNYTPPPGAPSEGYYAIIIRNRALTRKSRDGVALFGKRWVQRPDIFEQTFKGICRVERTDKHLAKQGFYRLLFVQQ